jgi:hypothetical protein
MSNEFLNSLPYHRCYLVDLGSKLWKVVKNFWTVSLNALIWSALEWLSMRSQAEFSLPSPVSYNNIKRTFKQWRSTIPTNISKTKNCLLPQSSYLNASYLNHWTQETYEDTRVIRRVPHVEQELFTLPEHLISLQIFSGVLVIRSLNWQTYQIMLYISPWSRFELTTAVVLATDCIGSCKYNAGTVYPPRASDFTPDF